MGNQIVKSENITLEHSHQTDIDKYFDKLITYSSINHQKLCNFSNDNCCINSDMMKHINKIIKNMPKEQKEKILSIDNNLVDNKLLKYYISKAELILKIKHAIYCLVNSKLKSDDVTTRSKNIILLNKLTDIYNDLIIEKTVVTKHNNVNKNKIIIYDIPITLSKLSYNKRKVNKITRNLY